MFKDLSSRFEEVNQLLNSLGVGNVFYSKEWYDFLRMSKGQSPFVYGVESDGGELIAVMAGSVESNYFWPICKLTSRAIIHGGPYVKNNDLNVLRFLLENYNMEIKHKAIYSQFRNNADMSWASSVFKDVGYSYEPHLDIFIDLTQSQDDLTKKISRNKRRNVTKSINKGAVIRIIEDKEEYIKSLELIYRTYKRIGLPIADKSFFTNVFENFQPIGMLKCFALFKESHCVGVRLELVYNGLIYDWYAGSDHNYKNLYPNDVLPYYILQWGQENNYTTFDFGGAGEPGVPYGVRDHKLKFGGELVEFGRFEKVHNKLLMKIGESGFVLYKLIKSNGIFK